VPGSFPPKTHQNPRNITFYALKPHPTTTQRIAANPWAVGRVTPCTPPLTSQRTSFPQPPPSQCFNLKKPIMQVPDFTTCYVRSQSAQDAGRVATGFPLPSTGRGIEGGLRVRGGHIQSRLPREPPMVDEVALRLRLPAEQALCGVASPRACA